MLVKTYASAVEGVDAQTITVEVNAGGSPGKKGFYFLVGLPDNAIKESFQRIETAIGNVGKRMKRVKTVVNLAPANIRKEGSAFDLPIAMACLGATDQVQHEEMDKYIMMGELSLDGSLRPIRGALPIAIQARKDNFKGLILPKENAREAAIVNDLDVYGVESLRDAIDFFNGKRSLEPTFVETREEFYHDQNNYTIDFSDVKGQENIKR
ncbi:MAG TPA: ATP-binding protein, partial [Saprospiraceae bacterium]|nr:ATP-binding protein [Saprospiraceae bacterium]